MSGFKVRPKRWNSNWADGRLATLAVLTSLALPAHAQVRPDAGSTLQQPAPRIEPTEPRQVLPRITPQPEPDVASDIKVTVKSFKFSGNTQIASDLLSAQLGAFTGKALDLTALRTATERIRDYYRSSGFFLAQAYLPR